MRMYDYTKAYVQLEDMLLHGELDDETYRDTIESLEGSAGEKAENLAKMIDNFKADEKKLADEIKKLQAKRKTLDNQVSFLTQELENFHKVAGIKSTGMYKFGYRKLPASVKIDDETLLPEAYFRIKKEPNKTDIKKAIQDGIEVAGAKLEQGLRFEVKK